MVFGCHDDDGAVRGRGRGNGSEGYKGFIYSFIPLLSEIMSLAGDLMHRYLPCLLLLLLLLFSDVFAIGFAGLYSTCLRW